MSGPRMTRREAVPLAYALSLALLAASAAPGRAQSASPAAGPTEASTTATAPGTAAPATTAKTATAKSPAASAQTAGAKGSTSGVQASPTASAARPAAASATPATAATVASTPKPTAAKKPTARADSSTVASTGTPSRSKKKGAAPAPGDSSKAGYTLRGGQEGTVFKSLTVEGEDRVHIDFARPELKLDLDLDKAPGLDWGSAADVLNRTASDLQTPLVELSAKQSIPYVARPWLSDFATGPVARFHPDAQGVERWKLVVVDSKGTAVMTFSGKGDPPREIDWDGRASDGTPVTPGRTYSYVFEAHDKAGNKRNVVGQGFAVSAYRIDAPDGPTLLFSATELRTATGASIVPAASGDAAAAPILLEAASWLNQSERLSQPIRVTATARSQELADQLAGSVRRALAPLVLGDPARVEMVSRVESDAPEAGTLSIAPGR